MSRLNHWLRRVIWVVCVMSLVMGTAGRLVIASRQRVLNHDEGITLIEATGHTYEAMDSFQAGQYPANTWIEAQDLKWLFEPEDSLIFKRIGREMAHTDVTPPLFFWIAHVWFLLFGTHASTGVALNVMISLATLAVVYALARRVFRDRWAALALAAAWFVNPTATYTTFFIRHYQLFTFFAVAFAYWSTAFSMNPNSSSLASRMVYGWRSRRQGVCCQTYVYLGAGRRGRSRPFAVRTDTAAAGTAAGGVVDRGGCAVCAFTP